MDRRDFFTRCGLGSYSLMVLADSAAAQTNPPRPDFDVVAPPNAVFSPSERHMKLLRLDTDV